MASPKGLPLLQLDSSQEAQCPKDLLEFNIESPSAGLGKILGQEEGFQSPVWGMVWALVLRITGAARITVEGGSFRDRWALRLIFFVFCF